ncbi:hypothetical protein NQ315_015399 [Exocentrus adspersus]|uniref:Uncharacterized protein n=1 Tax=Exocentrus adspersus TaxID=1586481 RepID=A0AAV8V9X7_9CUCU|nr:hypothetical protein NQ315_015399 [Exocentrus adspersus]
MFCAVVGCSNNNNKKKTFLDKSKFMAERSEADKRDKSKKVHLCTSNIQCFMLDCVRRICFKNVDKINEEFVEISHLTIKYCKECFDKNCHVS